MILVRQLLDHLIDSSPFELIKSHCIDTFNMMLADKMYRPFANPESRNFNILKDLFCGSINCELDISRANSEPELALGQDRII